MNKYITLLQNYNNYYNRTIKKEETYADYVAASGPQTYAYNNAVNFNHADGVNTTHIVNLPGEDEFIWNYLLVHDSNKNIISRWFIIDAERTAGGQYNMTLRRDVIVDNYDDIIEADMYVEKAVCRADDIAIYNKEQINFNEIKQDEHLIKDKTGKAYVVGYFATNTEDTNIAFNYEVEGARSITSMESQPIYEYLEDGYKYIRNRTNEYLNVEYWFDFNEGGINNCRVFNDNLEWRKERAEQGIKVRGYGKGNDITKCKTAITSSIAGVKDEYMTENDYHDEDIFSGFSSAYINITNAPTGSDYPNGLYYTTLTKQKIHVDKEWFNGGDYRATYRTNVENAGLTVDASDHDYFKVGIDYTLVKVNIVRVSDGDVSTKISGGSLVLKDAPYKMFCVPVDDINFAIKLGSTIITTLGSFSYDVQLLPFCPILDRYNEATGDFSRNEQGVDYEEIKFDGTTKAYLYYCETSRGTFNVDFTYANPLSVIDKKIANQCDKYRLCSPNYAAQFDFNLVRTDYIDTLNVDYTYKPFSPYIHINPVWHGLYGADYDDCRGLICQGDFSLPAMTDAWVEYQIQNKNYLNSFNRETESIEIQNRYNRINDIVGAAVGTVQGAASGMVYGGTGGAIAGGVASAIGGAADIYINEKLRNEALDLRQDQFNYSLQNIQALPYTLAKVSSFDFNNKIFPIIEYYSATEAEKEIFLNKLIYNGMTIERIDKISNFLDVEWDYDYRYIKGQLIRLELDDDTHMVNTIAAELYKGVYL